MKQSRLVFLLLMVSGLVAMEAQGQTVTVAGATINVATAQSSVDLRAEFAALRQAMRERNPSATLIIHGLDGGVSLRNIPTSYVARR